MRKHWNNPDTHFNKWNDYHTVQALIGHLISTRRHNAPRRCQVNEMFGQYATVGGQTGSRSGLEENWDASGWDAAFYHLGFSFFLFVVVLLKIVDETLGISVC